MQAPGHQRQIKEGRTGPTSLPETHGLPETPGTYLPTKSSSRSPAPGLSFLQMSMVKRVLLLLNMEVRDDMSAAIITAIIRPRSPGEERDRQGVAEPEAMGWGGVGWDGTASMLRPGVMPPPPQAHAGISPGARMGFGDTRLHPGMLGPCCPRVTHIPRPRFQRHPWRGCRGCPMHKPTQTIHGFPPAPTSKP